MGDFIELYDNVFDADYCNEAVRLIERAIDSGFGKNRTDTESINSTLKDDTQIFPSTVLKAGQVFESDFNIQFNKLFWSECYRKYADKYSILNDLSSHDIYGNKLQKTDVGQGYHLWHCEQTNQGNCNRLLAYIVYLNDIEEGGETEFLYQHKRIKPKQGTVVIWPAGFTHTHRGNPPLSNTKYIMTGWVEY